MIPPEPQSGSGLFLPQTHRIPDKTGRKIVVYSTAIVGRGYDPAAHLMGLGMRNIPGNGSSQSSKRSGGVITPPYRACAVNNNFPYYYIE